MKLYISLIFHYLSVCYSKYNRTVSVGINADLVGRNLWRKLAVTPRQERGSAYPQFVPQVFLWLTPAESTEILRVPT